jgi:hypothetical protein
MYPGCTSANGRLDFFSSRAVARDTLATVGGESVASMGKETLLVACLAADARFCFAPDA